MLLAVIGKREVSPVELYGASRDMSLNGVLRIERVEIVVVCIGSREFQVGNGNVLGGVIIGSGALKRAGTRNMQIVTLDDIFRQGGGTIDLAYRGSVVNLVLHLRLNDPAVPLEDLPFCVRGDILDGNVYFVVADIPYLFDRGVRAVLGFGVLDADIGGKIDPGSRPRRALALRSHNLDSTLVNHHILINRHITGDRQRKAILRNAAVPVVIRAFYCELVSTRAVLQRMRMGPRHR